MTNKQKQDGIEGAPYPEDEGRKLRSNSSAGELFFSHGSDMEEVFARANLAGSQLDDMVRTLTKCLELGDPWGALEMKWRIEASSGYEGQARREALIAVQPWSAPLAQGKAKGIGGWLGRKINKKPPVDEAG